MNYSTSEEDDLLIVTSLFVIIELLKIRRQQRKRRLRERLDWLHKRRRVRPLALRMQAAGDEYQNLFKILLEEQDNVKFFKYTRMTFIQWERLLNLVTPFLRKSHNGRGADFSPERDLVITIRYFVTGSQFCDLAMTFGCTGESTVGSVVRRTSLAIIQALRPTELYNRNEYYYRYTMKKFWTDRQMPNCCGVIAGKHITVQKLPNPNAGTSHHNDGDRFSLVLLAICDANYRFTSIDIGQYDSVSDGGVFSESPTSEPLNEKADLPREPLTLPNTNVAIPAYFVADEAFPLSTRIMRPYPGENLDKGEQIFNYRLSRVMSLIENTFGILAMRWKIFRTPITVKDVEGIDHIVQSILCLHNYLQPTNNEMAENQHLYCPKNVVDHEDSNGVLIPGRWRQKSIAFAPIPAGKPNESAANVHMHRQLLKDFFVSDKSCPWQESYALKDESIVL
ncbi:uncharacterized protein LOC135849995 [Planococcus citri]|uniref:uncharacterized protein LOC135849995 n=1 Tax=Planococcus citri TaxID=170843 RepID=UPI0031F962DB